MISTKQEEKKPQIDDLGFTSGFMIGAVAGAIAFFLFGTKKGKKIKKKLIHYSKNYFEEINKFSLELQPKLKADAKALLAKTSNLKKEIYKKKEELTKQLEPSGLKIDPILSRQAKQEQPPAKEPRTIVKTKTPSSEKKSIKKTKRKKTTKKINSPRSSHKAGKKKFFSKNGQSLGK